MDRRLFLVLALTGCTSAASFTDPGNPGDDGTATEGPPPDDFQDHTLPADDGWVPHAMTATRFGVFYQISQDVLDVYQDPTRGLPQSADHAWLITHSHATAFAARSLADLVHRRADFYYAPAFDLWDASHDGWASAPDATLAKWAHEFRDAAIAAHADLFTLNECPSTTGASATVRVQIASILRHLHEPDAKGRRLSGVVYFTEKPGLPGAWSVPASDFFAAIDETSVALVIEHYHSNGYVCGNTEATLASHYFGLRDWLVASGEPAKLSIANSKFTILHSSRFDAGPSGWSGGDSDTTTLADYQRTLSRASQVTRDTAGGYNRLAFGPTTSALTAPGVQPRITELFRWHYLHTTPQASEEACVAGSAGNCTCQ
jgi:hypothetical protein